MELTIFGATGATGTCLTELALAAGHQVTAVVRDPARMSVPARAGLRVVTADLMDRPRSASQWRARARSRRVRAARHGPTTVLREGTRA
jgi:putative NADH-flavin reductase